jgi:hypothetical protein
MHYLRSIQRLPTTNRTADRMICRVRDCSAPSHGTELGVSVQKVGIDVAAAVPRAGAAPAQRD